MTTDKHLTAEKDNAVAFQLMVVHSIDLKWFMHGVEASSAFSNSLVSFQLYKDYPTKEAAARYAIEQAVINKLKFNKE